MMASGGYGLDGFRVLGGPKRDAISKGVIPLTLLFTTLVIPFSTCGTNSRYTRYFRQFL